MVQAKSSYTSETKQVVQNSKESKIRMLASLFILRNQEVGSSKEYLYFKSDKKAVKLWKADITLHIVNTL